MKSLEVLNRILKNEANDIIFNRERCLKGKSKIWIRKTITYILDAISFDKHSRCNIIWWYDYSFKLRKIDSIIFVKVEN